MEVWDVFDCVCGGGVRGGEGRGRVLVRPHFCISVRVYVRLCLFLFVTVCLYSKTQQSFPVGTPQDTLDGRN